MEVEDVLPANANIFMAFMILTGSYFLFKIAFGSGTYSFRHPEPKEMPHDSDHSSLP
jgi:hypothetical protein